MNKISKQEFIDRIKTIHSAISVRGIKYSNIQLCGLVCKGIRDSTHKPFQISLDKLYEAYKELDVINTTTLKSYVNRAQSPALAILMKVGLV